MNDERRIIDAIDTAYNGACDLNPQNWETSNIKKYLEGAQRWLEQWIGYHNPDLYREMTEKKG